MVLHGFTHGVRLSEVDQIKSLPAIQGIYVLLRQDRSAERGWRILYVGKSMCLAARTRGNNHHVLSSLKDDENVFLLLHPLPGATAMEVDAFERETIKNLRPELNLRS
jgi:excinuclease UvrABC nuclease subunit